MSCVIGLDVGTTGVRAIVWDRNAQKLGMAYEKLTITHSESNAQAIQDPIAIFSACVKVIKLALLSAEKEAHEVQSIGLATQRNSWTVWDPVSGNPVLPLILWSDQRTSADANAANERFLPQLVRFVCSIAYFFTRFPKFLTGSTIHLTTHHINLKIKHVFLRNPEIRNKVENGEYSFGTLDTWLIWKLTGGQTYVTDYSNISASGMWDPYDMRWSGITKMLCYLRFGDYHPPYSIFPPIKDTSDDFGTCDISIFGVPIPINAIAGDQMASAFGHGCFAKGDVKVTLGTGGFLDINTGDRCLASAHYIYPIVGWKRKNNTTFLLEGTVNSVGSIIDWMLKNEFISSFEELSRILETSVDPPEENDYLYFVPAFSGLSTPHHNPGARGMFIGLTHSTTKTDMIKAMVESIGFRIKQVMDALYKDTGIPIKKIYIDGGVSQNDHVLQSMADILGIDVIRSKHPEMTCLGAAFLAGLHVGFWRDTAEIKKLTTQTAVFSCRTTPETRKRRMKQFDDACTRSKNWVERSKPSRKFKVLFFLISFFFVVFFLFYF